MRSKGFTAMLARLIFNGSHRFVIAVKRAKFSVAIAKEFLFALLASFYPFFTSIPTSLQSGASSRAANLFYLMRLESFAADWTYFVSKRNESVNFIVAIRAQSYSIIYIISKGRVLCPFLDMMCLQDTAFVSTFLTSPIITSQYGDSPFFIFSPSISNVAFSGPVAFSSLVVRQSTSFFHCLLVHRFTLIRFQELLSALGYLSCAFWAFVETFPRAILTGVAFVLGFKLRFTELADSNHLNLSPNKTPLAAGCPFVTTQADNRAGVRNDNTIAVKIEQLFCLCGRGIIA